MRLIDPNAEGRAKNTWSGAPLLGATVGIGVVLNNAFNRSSELSFPLTLRVPNINRLFITNLVAYHRLNFSEIQT